MRLLEYQAKTLFAEYKIPIPKGLTSTNIEQGRKDAAVLGFPFVIKAQMAVGGRGKAGAIQKCQNADEFELKYPEIMQKVVKGEKTKAILLEKMADIKKELELAEINPLAILGDGSIVALDGKVIIDDNAMFRHDELRRFQEVSDLEERAEKSGFSLVELDGNIAVVGNGAGLVMSSLDM